MPLQTSLIGSYPPIHSINKNVSDFDKGEFEASVRKSIERAVDDQLNLGIDILVSGQCRNDVVSLICPGLPGISGAEFPYRVTGKIKPADESLSVGDYIYAQNKAPNKEFKAHVVGPFTLARSLKIDPTSPYTGRSDPNLIKDIAHALAVEAKYFVQAGASIVQIDEPVLADGANLALAAQVLKLLVEKGEIPYPVLHICGNVSAVFEEICQTFPFKAISIEGSWLNRKPMHKIDAQFLLTTGVKVGLGCISVIDYEPERVPTIQRFLSRMIRRLGEENIWAVLPDCGFRTIPYEVAYRKIEVLTKAAHTIGSKEN